MRGRFTPGANDENGATAVCWRASTTRRSGACARRSNRSRRAIFCASCSPGSVLRRNAHGRAGCDAGRDRGAARRLRGAGRRRGRAKSCRRGSPVTSRPGSTTNAWPAGSPGRGCRRRRRGRARPRPAVSIRATPIALLARRNAPLWMSLRRRPKRRSPAPARNVLECLTAQGASFFDEMTAASRLLRSQVEEALGELVALGLVTSDSFGGLRALLVPPTHASRSTAPRGAGACRPSAWRAAGRWAWRAAPRRAAIEQAAVEHVAARAAAPLRRGVLADAGARGGLAAAVARSAARISPARSARRNTRRPFRRRFFGRAIRPARGDRAVARDAPKARR